MMTIAFAAGIVICLPECKKLHDKFIRLVCLGIGSALCIAHDFDVDLLLLVGNWL